MAINFFSKFPKVSYSIDEKDSFLNLTNFVRNVDVDEALSNNSTYYEYHYIPDGERPDTVSYKFYGSPNYHWTFFIVNNHLRAGLNMAWPLSYKQIEKMFVREYDPYTVLSFKQQDGINTNGLKSNGLIHLLDLSDKYLPFLRIVNAAGTVEGNILKYDNQLCQLLIYDLKQINTGSPIYSFDSLLLNPHFTIKWNNPFIVGSPEANINELLRVEFVNSMIATYIEFDDSAKINPDRYNSPEISLTQNEINQFVINDNSLYIFGKEYKLAPRVFQWASYRNAASEYYREDEYGQKTSASAFDILSEPNLITPKYLSFFEKETLLNEEKSMIRVIRKEALFDFVNSYFRLLNG